MSEAIMSLEDLKKENLEEEQGVIEVPEETPEEALEEALEPEETPAAEIDEEEEGEPEAAEIEDWMKPEEADEDGAPKFTDSDAAAIRRKYKAREEKLREEAEAREKALKEQLEAAQTASKPLEMKRPSRDDFESEDDYQDALVDYRVNTRAAQAQSAYAAEKQQREQEERRKAIENGVNEHYMRVHALAEKSGIKPETYQEADLRVREAIDDVFGDTGDTITDFLISNLGEGSEKVMYHLGVNPKKLAQLADTFRKDPNGLQAMRYLGNLQAQLNAPVTKRVSSAPAPGEQIQGDKGGSVGERSLREKWQRAHQKGDTQAAFDIKRQAKAKGINTRAW